MPCSKKIFKQGKYFPPREGIDDFDAYVRIISHLEISWDIVRNKHVVLKKYLENIKVPGEKRQEETSAKRLMILRRTRRITARTTTVAKFYRANGSTRRRVNDALNNPVEVRTRRVRTFPSEAKGGEQRERTKTMKLWVPSCCSMEETVPPPRESWLEPPATKSCG